MRVMPPASPRVSGPLGSSFETAAGGNPSCCSRAVAALAHTVVEVAVNANDTEVVLTVDDDGNGVPAAERTRIFERFARLQDSRSRDAGGAGLGLAVVVSVTDAFGGTIRVSDAPLGGARFEVRLPVAPVTSP